VVAAASGGGIGRRHRAAASGGGFPIVHYSDAVAAGKALPSPALASAYSAAHVVVRIRCPVARGMATCRGGAVYPGLPADFSIGEMFVSRPRQPMAS